MLESLKLNSHDVVIDNQTVATFLARNDKDLTRSKPVEISDEALMVGYAKGNMRAFETLYLRHKDPLLRYFLRQTNIRASAEELFQETWQSLIRNSANYQTSAKFSTYLYKIAHSRLVDHYRKQGRADWQSIEESEEFGQLLELSASSETQPNESLYKEESKQHLLKGLEQLPANQREVVVLKFENGLTVREIAETLDENAEAVKSRLRYALSKLKNYFETNGLTPFEFASGEDYE